MSLQSAALHAISSNVQCCLSTQSSPGKFPCSVHPQGQGHSVPNQQPIFGGCATQACSHTGASAILHALPKTSGATSKCAPGLPRGAAAHHATWHDAVGCTGQSTELSTQHPGTGALPMYKDSTATLTHTAALTAFFFCCCCCRMSSKCCRKCGSRRTITS